MVVHRFQENTAGTQEHRVSLNDHDSEVGECHPLLSISLAAL
jgi:hypothetical protein